ncbi:MAG: winged helix-turn-helix transcriptional regulator [Ideonella sp.]|nr:winged helix-turn-helix transcriptional regulator [Ideonella sp.]MCC7458592.1 winged helix-turn-helix transcriptional regulator [Nitrospira sp.]
MEREQAAPHARLAPQPVTVSEMVESIVGCKWSIGLLRLVADGVARPGELLRASPGLSTKVMNERLRKLTRFGIVQRSVRGHKPPLEVEYRLTAFGQRFDRLLDEVKRLQADVDRGAIAPGETR